MSLLPMLNLDGHLSEFFDVILVSDMKNICPPCYFHYFRMILISRLSRQKKQNAIIVHSTLCRRHSFLGKICKIHLKSCMSIVIKISLRLPKIQYGDNIVKVVKEYTNIGLKSYCYGKFNKDI